MVSVLLPTMGRPDRAEATVRQLVETTEGHDLEILCVVDNDPVTAERLMEYGRDLDTPTDRLLEILVITHDEPRGCSAAWNSALASSCGDLIVFAADDLQWQPGWLDQALTVMETFGPDGGLVGFNDGHWNGWELSTHYLMSRRFVLEVLGGVVAWDFYRHSFNDLEVNERAKRAGRFAWAEHAHVRHEHWTFGDREQDDTDRATLGDWQASHDRYQERQAAGFPVDYPPAIRE